MLWEGIIAENQQPVLINTAPRKHQFFSKLFLDKWPKAPLIHTFEYVAMYTSGCSYAILRRGNIEVNKEENGPTPYNLSI